MATNQKTSPEDPSPKKATDLEAVPIKKQQIPLEDLSLFLDILPARIRHCLEREDLHQVVEVVMDLGRLPEVRFVGGRMISMTQDPVTPEDIQFVVNNIGSFTNDNRAGIPKTLHRISAIRNRKGTVVGLTCRVGKAIVGTIECIRDLVESEKSILVLGRPGVGKTTRLREIAKLMADEIQKRVVVVDTSNEIAGDGDVPHYAVGRARRMQVSQPEEQERIMIEAVENHTPQVIVVDEIGTMEEAMAARTIAERGVILVATAHGNTLENLIKNPMLSDLVGGIQSVTLGDDEAKRRSSQKTVLEREKQPTFDIVIEIRDRNTLAVYPNVAEAVDHLLRGWTLFPEVRKVDSKTGSTQVLQPEVPMVPPEEALTKKEPLQPKLGGPTPADIHAEFNLYLYAITKGFVERILDRLQLSHRVALTENLHDAHAAIALKGQTRPGSKFLKTALEYDIPIFYAKSNTMPQIQRALREALETVPHEGDSPPIHGVWSRLPWEPVGEGTSDVASDEAATALREAMEAIDQVLQEGQSVKLAPRRSYIRRLQHELVEKYNLLSLSVGDEPNRCLKIIPPKNWEKADPSPATPEGAS